MLHLCPVEKDVCILSSVESATETKAALAEAHRLAQGLASLGAELVVLFGSRAQGRARAGSDIDLLVVMPTHCRFIYRPLEVQKVLCPLLQTDMLIYTPEEFQKLYVMREFVYDAVEKGIVLHGKRP